MEKHDPAPAPTPPTRLQHDLGNRAFGRLLTERRLSRQRDALAPRIIHYGLDDLDAGDLRRRAPRRLTQEISRYVFALADATGRAAFQGIRYASRLGDDLANWAIFEPNEPTALSSAEIDEDDADLQAVLADYDITFVD